MLVSEYLEIVKNTEQFSNYDIEIRKQITLYGLVGEIGSLTSAVKKIMLAKYENAPNDEITEELGDVFWYLFNLTIILDINKTDNILKQDIVHIKKEVTEPSDRGERIRNALVALDGERLLNFKSEAEKFLSLKAATFDQYQQTAYLTARTKGHVLNDVCLAVLWQLGAELLRKFAMPPLELGINTNITPRDTQIVIGEIAWHLAAIASVHDLKLDEIIEKNVGKARFRSCTENPTGYYDQEYPAEEHLPRKFEITFVSPSSKRARMYYQGHSLGDDLTDNSHYEDGYRFHDVMHLANAACLRWSPVLRRLLKKKRKSCPKTDEVEDGARAAIVEELVIKAIHTEGNRLRPNTEDTNSRLFPQKGHITFRLIKTLVEYVKGLEVANSQEWQWREAIFQGAGMYHKLRQEGQGTVTVDLEKRSLSFDPRISIGIKGVVYEMGTSAIKLGDVAMLEHWMTAGEKDENPTKSSKAEVIATKKAILNALGFSESDENSHIGEIVLSRLDSGKFSVKATGCVRHKMWDKEIIEFKPSWNHVNGLLCCTVLGLADPKDVTP